MMKTEDGESTSGVSGKRPTDDVESGNPVRAAEAVGVLEDPCEGGDTPLIEALADARRAMERATAIGQERKTAINRRYYNGLNAGLDPCLMDAFKQTGLSWTSLSALADDMKSRFQGTPIYKLPMEIMLTVFSFMDTETLTRCRSTCQEWQTILTSRVASDAVLADKQIELHGTLEELDAKWKEIKKIFHTPTCLSLKVHSSQREGSSLQQICNLRMIRHFPSRWLRSFAYEGVEKHLHSPVWACVKECRSLKVLKWKPAGQSKSSVFPYEVEADSPLASCRLEEFDFEVEESVGELKIDLAFVGLLSQVRSLHLNGGLGLEHVQAIFAAAANTLEEVTITNSNMEASWIGPQPKKVYHFNMTKLQKVSLDDVIHSFLSINAPEATSVRFVLGASADWSIVKSCRNKLRSLHIKTRSRRTTGGLAQELFDMPLLEDLQLDYTSGGRTELQDYSLSNHIVRYEDYSTAAFWQTLDNDDLTEVGSIFPKLKSLEIIHDPMLDEEKLLKYIERRAVIGQPALESVRIHLANHCSDLTSRLDKVQATMPVFQCKRFEEWKGWKTREWSLTTSLDYCFEICWEGFNQCRGIMKKLRIEYAALIKGLEKEIFNLPQLESLDISFKDVATSRYSRGAFALWRMVSTGKTYKKGVSLQDILPKLRELKITDDAKLDEDTILRFIDLRKSLNLTTIESMEICLAEKYTYRTGKLEQLKSTMPGFQYWLYDDWYTETEYSEDPEGSEYSEDPEDSD